jgi:NADH:ubiquinone oxidoreductase subunit 3 (subunit A)
LGGKEKGVYQIEGGYQNINKTSLKSFSIRFYTILILYIIFDLELIFSLPLFVKNSFFISFICTNFIIFTLIID